MIKMNDVKTLIENLTLPGFKMSKGNAAFIWQRKIEDRTMRIGVSVRKGVDCFYIQAPVGELILTDISNKLNKVIQEATGNAAEKDYCINFPSFHDFRVNYEIFHNKIFDEQSFNVVATEFRKVLDYGIVPFFNQMSSIEEVANYFAKLKIAEIPNYVPGSILYPFTALVLKEAKHPDLHKKVNELMDRANKFQDDPRIITAIKATEIIMKM